MKPKIYRAKVPVIIDGDVANPFLYLTLTGELERPMVTFDPSTVMLTPVPLGVSSSAKFTLSMAGYRRYTSVLNDWFIISWFSTYQWL